MTQVVFWIVVASATISIAGVLLTWGRPSLGFWPPPRGGSWQAFLSWVFIEVTMLGPLVLGALDWDGWAIPSGVRLFGGLVLVPVGFGVGLASMRQLTVAASFGLEHRLVTGGPYRYSRNPQCVGFSVGYLGFALMCSSLLAFVAAVLLSVELCLSPFAEEPWLRDRYGEAYEGYARRVPRFIGVPRTTH